MSKRQRLNEDDIEQYAGYIPENGAAVDQIEFENIDTNNFYHQFVNPRKPVKILNGKVIDTSSFLPRAIVQYLDYAEDLQVERKHDSGYGLGHDRAKMSLETLMKNLTLGDVNHYLTTQYLEEEEEEEEGNDDDDGLVFNNKKAVGGDEEDDQCGIVDVVENDVIEEHFNNISGRNKDNNNNYQVNDKEKAFNKDVNKGEPFGLPHKDSNNADHVVVSKDQPMKTGGTSVDEEDEEDEEDGPAEEPSFSPFSDDSDWGDRDDYVDDYVEDPEDVNGKEEEEDDDEEEEGELDDKQRMLRIQLLLQPPLTNLYRKKLFPLRPEFLQYLAPQQINLWMGANYSSKKEDQLPILNPNKKDLGLGRYVPGGGTSSGLHHDHSDNLYILINGWKRFTMFPPNEAHNLHTVGKIHRIYGSGVIDYLHPGWKQVRDDGAIIDEPREISKPSLSEDNTPPSFSQIPPLLLHLDEVEDPQYASQARELTSKFFPNLEGAPKIVSILAPGEMLYLPAGWFHEVTSYGYDPRNVGNTERSASYDTTVHAALNYWFAPPNGSSIDLPYRDSYWSNDFDETLNQISLAYGNPH